MRTGSEEAVPFPVPVRALGLLGSSQGLVLPLREPEDRHLLHWRAGEDHREDDEVL